MTLFVRLSGRERDPGDPGTNYTLYISARSRYYVHTFSRRKRLGSPAHSWQTVLLIPRGSRQISCSEQKFAGSSVSCNAVLHRLARPFWETECKECGNPIPCKHCCIYKVPKKLRDVSPEAYTPSAVAIGPFHPLLRKGCPTLERLKRRYLMSFCNLARKKEKDLTEFIKERIDKIRYCYSESFDLSDDAFVEMIVHDAVFIVELFWRYHSWTTQDHRGEECPEVPYHLSVNPCRRNNIKEDLLLLESQLPYFILEELYSKFVFKLDYQQVRANKKGILHFTDLMRTVYCDGMPPIGKLEAMNNATKLNEAGLEFKGIRLEEKELKLEFHHPKILESLPCLNSTALLNCFPCLKSIPCLERLQPRLEFSNFVVEKGSESLCRNIMALEQCHYPFAPLICKYVFILDYLIVNEKDVDLLVDKKVIVNGLGTSEGALQLIKKFCDQIVPPDDILHDRHRDPEKGLCKRLNKFYESPWNRIVAALASTYFSNFWRGTATIAGLMVLGFAFWNFLRPFVMKA
ncbi:hypothetical protein CJ030_MR0G026998 [Morella rubra]|uniref:Uncharacterized protein n=1 Tax=Morella rubra TaxID=262757 RepID=A0A6A1UG06_9ROSI|nr:hypothetical protein CJ030_MR0G026998 [Morella rubra]